MSTFWNIWVIACTAVFLFLMYWVVTKLWRSNDTADADKTLASFDGIEENDAPLPRTIFIAYGIALVLAAVHLTLYPGLGNWKGLMNWQQSDDKLSATSTTLDQQFEHIGSTSLDVLSGNAEIVSAGRMLFQTHCAACHRENAQGQKHFPNLIDYDWLYGADDKSVLQSITQGRHGAMPGWSEVLNAEQIANLAYYIISLNSARTSAVADVKLKLGGNLFREYCSSCHGNGRTTDPKLGTPALSDDIWLHGGSFEELQHTIAHGVSSIMPAFAGKLSQNEILALGAYINKAGKDEQQRLSSLEADSVKRGAYLARAGDCVACHSSEGGEPMAGGLPFITPFGTLYSTNISPHVSEGIGDYSFDDFRRALIKGEGRHGYLYPAMPYTSYQYLTEEDMADLWAYLQSITAVARRNEANSMMFPSNIRLGLLGWNLVFMNTEKIDYSLPAELQGRVTDVEKWQRGKYWVSGLGHCSECHTPRNFAQALIPERVFQGNIIDGWNAPDITAQELYVGGWTEKSLTDFLHTGQSDKGTAFAGMADVVKNSLSHMTRDDISTISYYLLNGDVYNLVADTATPLQPKGFDDTAYQDPIYATFKVTCGACHGEDGRGRDPIAPTLLNNGMIMHRDPFNTIAVAVRGLEPSYLDHKRHYMPMASFDDVLSDEHLARLISFTRKYLGGRDEPVAANAIRDVRDLLEDAGYVGGIHQTP